MMTKLSFWVNYSFKAILYTSILSFFGSPQQSDTHNRFGTFLHLMPFLPQPRPESGTHANSVLGHTHSLNHSHKHSLITANFLCPIHLYGMSLDCGETGVPWGNPRRHWDMHKEHANSTQKVILAQLGLEPGTFLLWGNSATHRAKTLIYLYTILRK